MTFSGTTNEIEYFKKMALNLKLELETGIKQPPAPLPLPVFVHLSCLQGKATVNDGISDILGAVYNHLGFDDL